MSLGPIDIIGMLLIVGGLVFFLGASVGLLRFPDFYTRMHAAGKGDTLSTLMILAGLALLAVSQIGVEGPAVILVAIKIFAIGILITLTSPASTHALMKAGYEDKIEPVGEGEEMQIVMPKLNGQTAIDQVQVEPAKKTATKKKGATKKTTSTKKSTAKKKAPSRKKD